MTGYHLLDHPNPACPERGDGRYWGYQEMNTVPRLISVHTTESFADEVGEDMGAENVAAYFARSTTAASYHTLVDSDSTVRCLPAGLDGTTVHTAFHCYGRNSGNLGISFAMRATEWATVSEDWKTKTLNRAADEVALWCKQHGIPPVLVTAAEVDAGAWGITGHGLLQDDRSDPGASRTFDPSLFPWQRFIELVQARLSGGENKEGNMPGLITNVGNSGSWWGCYADGIWKPLSGPELYAARLVRVPTIELSEGEFGTLREWGRVA